jgi:release factor glutamine methyltransferase
MTKEEGWLLQEKYKGEETEAFFADGERLTKGEPLAYIIGHIPFLSATIYLDSHPLIPRVETEFWVSKVLEEIQQSSLAHPNVLDLCAGSGCIGVAVAKAIPRATVHFAEIDEAHHRTIAQNIVRNDISKDRTAIFGGSLFENTHAPYDFILSNPPYIRNGSEAVARSVKDFEPKLALYGGEDGLTLIAKIIAQAPKHLSASGRLFIEHEPQQVAALHAHAKAHSMEALTHNDQYGVSRYTAISMAQ